MEPATSALIFYTIMVNRILNGVWMIKLNDVSFRSSLSVIPLNQSINSMVPTEDHLCVKSLVCYCSDRKCLRNMEMTSSFQEIRFSRLFLVPQLWLSTNHSVSTMHVLSECSIF